MVNAMNRIFVVSERIQRTVPLSLPTRVGGHSMVNAMSRIFVASERIRRIARYPVNLGESGAEGSMPKSLRERVTGRAGTRFDFPDGKPVQSDDGFSSIDPMFYFNSNAPDTLVESWSATYELPILDLISGRVDVDDLPSNVVESIILNRTDSVIHAITVSGRGTEMYSTTLYLDESVAVFTRAVMKPSVVPAYPMGGMFAATCNFMIVP